MGGCEAAGHSPRREPKIIRNLEPIMFRASFLRRLVNSSRRPESKPVRRRRLAVETLEAREVPALITVTSLVDNTTIDGQVTLREAILSANADAAVNTDVVATDAYGADTIKFSVTGTINLTQALPALSSNLTITGPAAGVTVRRDTGGFYRIFTINSGVTAAISGLTVSNGDAAFAAYGGGISNSGTLTLTDCTVSGNTATYGGGISNSGALTLTDCAVSGNTEGYDGGGIYDTGTLTLTDCTVSGNMCHRQGGGLYIFGGTVTLVNTTVAGNGAGMDGGIENAGTLTLTDCTVSGNTATFVGGIDNAGTLTLTDCTVSGNTAEFVEGGTGGIENAGTLTLTNCTVSGNTAYDAGGGIRNDGTLTLTNCTVTQNHDDQDDNGSGSGGGIFNNSTVTLVNTIVADNYLGSGTATESDIVINGTGTVDQDHSFNNLIGTGGAGGLVSGTKGNIVGVADPKLGPLSDNGGPTKTHALLPGSPAINAGSNSDVPAGVTSDERGPGFARISGGTVDIGAFEIQQNQAPTVNSFTKIGAENNTLTFAAKDFTDHYADADGDALAKVRIDTLPTGGVLKFNGVAVTLHQEISAASLNLLAFVPNHNFSGPVTFQYSASDGTEFAASPATVTLNIRSADQQAVELDLIVQALVHDGVLTSGQGDALSISLRDNHGDIGKVQAFLNQVKAFLQAGILNQTQAGSLLGPGNILLISVTLRQ